MIRHRWNTALWLFGAAVLVVSIAWWWVVYRQVVGRALISMPRAVACLYGGSDLCTLAQALCTSSEHFLGIRHYETYLFWTGSSVVALAAVERVVLRRRLVPTDPRHHRKAKRLFQA